MTIATLGDAVRRRLLMHTCHGLGRHAGQATLCKPMWPSLLSIFQQRLVCLTFAAAPGRTKLVNTTQVLPPAALRPSLPPLEGIAAVVCHVCAAAVCCAVCKQYDGFNFYKVRHVSVLT